MDDAHRPAFVARMAEFNLHPARYAHASWLPKELGADLHDAARRDRRCETAVSSWLCRRLDLVATTDWQMHEPEKRVFLIDQASVGALGRDVSLVLHREWLARTIDGREVRALHDCIEPDAWRFAVDETPAHLIRHDAPTVDFAASGLARLGSALERDGGQFLLSLLPSGWRAMRQRARMRFDDALDPRHPPLAGARRAQALDLLFTHLLPRRFPQWAWLF